MVARVATSKHLRTSTELTLVAPIRPEMAFSVSNDCVPMATRLGALLSVFFELRRAAVERALDGTLGPLERMRTLHNFCWSVFDNGQKLLLTVTFDRPWEPYIRAIVDQAGPILDVIFCHCQGYELSSTEHGYVPFADWVRQRQLDVSLFYSAEPDLTVDDQRYLRELERLQRQRAVSPQGNQRVAGAALGEPGLDDPAVLPGASMPVDRAESHAVAEQRLGRAAAALAGLRDLFPARAGDDASARERRFFDRAAWLLLQPIAGADGEGIARLPEPLARAVAEMREVAEAAPRAVRQSGPPAPSPEEAAAERERLGRVVQANILTPYSRTTLGCAVLLGFDGASAARAFTRRMSRCVTAHAAADKLDTKVNVALTFQGFRTLGLSQAELALFPVEFREGMAGRAGLLGDVGPEHPDNWSGPRRNGLDADPDAPLASLSEVDMLLLLQARGQSEERAWGPAHPLYAELTRLLVDAPGVRVVSVLPLQRELVDGPVEGSVKERFGYVDGVSQPVAAPWAGEQPRQDRVALGEILLGHSGDRGVSERYPAGPETFTRDGSFLVVRQLEQDVEAFEAFVDEYAGSFAGGREALYAKLMGRQRDGWSPVSPGSVNDFDYSSDVAGERCPLASHVRRSNPRTPPTESVHGLALRVPRIMRRGFSYGPFSRSVSGARGLLFMAYNASLAEQFEVIQRWINGANSTGVLSAHDDPIVSHRAGQVITLLDGHEPRFLLKRKPFVKLIWGAYFFAPSKPALEALGQLDDARLARDAGDHERVARGGQLIRQLRALESLGGGQAAFAWKRLLEDRLAPEARDGASAVWAFIRSERGGVLSTPYGVLVGSADPVCRVLGDEAHFSVCEYGRRMQASVGLLYLGMDRCPVTGRATSDASASEVRAVAGSYREAADAPNAFMASLSREDAMQSALPLAQRHFARLGPYVDLAELAKSVVSDVSRAWFGLPRDRSGYDIHHTAALAIFYPNPEQVVERAAAALGSRLVSATIEATSDDPPLAQALRQQEFEGDVAMALVGAAQGTLAATVGSFVSVATYCLESDRLGRLAAWLATDDGKAWRADPLARRRSGNDAPIVREVLAALCTQPAPDLLHRTVVAPTRLGDVDLGVGDRVVVSLGSAIAGGLAQDERIALLFGGRYPSTGDAPKHPCPGREAALGLILALLVTVLENDVRREGGLRVSRRA